MVCLASGEFRQPVPPTAFGQDGSPRRRVETIEPTSGFDRLRQFRREFAQAVESGNPPEVDATVGMKALALSYALLESGEVGAPVSLDDVMEGRVAEYQRSIDADNGV